MKRRLFAITALFVVLFTVEGPADASQAKLSTLMADKLRQSQRLIEGIALADFNKIAESAERLIQISKTAEWFAFKTPRYELYSNEFRRAAETVAQKAKARNIDGVVLAYMDLTMTCVRCHQYVREVRDASIPSPHTDVTARR
jgi:hypothetical protein